MQVTRTSKSVILTLTNEILCNKISNTANENEGLFQEN